MRRVLVAAIAVAVAALLGGCAREMEYFAYKQQKYETVMDEMVHLPSIEEVRSRYSAMLSEMRHAVSAVAPQVEWSDPKDVKQTSCQGELSGLGVSRVHFPAVSWSWSASDEDWPRMLGAVTEVASRYGFSDPNTVAGQSGNRDVRLFDDHGGSVTFGYYKALILGATSGCYARQEVKDKFAAGDRVWPTYSGPITLPSTTLPSSILPSTSLPPSILPSTSLPSTPER